MTTANELSAVAASAALAGGELTVSQLVDACLERIAAREDEVAAWSYIDPEAMRAAARRLDEQQPAGLLFGLPVGIKDIIDTHDAPTEYGCAAFKGHQPVTDAACVALVRQAGGLSFGKTVTTELAYFTPGKTVNPHNPAHTPGGSSSGSAAAVADKMVPLAFGTQTGGSVIRPASFCGIVGYKATHEGLPLFGVSALAHSLDTLGFFAREVPDIALMRAAMVGSPPTVAEVAPPRVGLCRTCEWDQAEAPMQAAVEGAARAAEAAGASLQDIDLPAPFEHAVEAQKLVMAYDAGLDLAHLYLERRDGLSRHIVELIETGRNADYQEYLRATDLARRCRRLMADIFTEVDVLLCPSAAGEAPTLDKGTGDPLFNRMWTLLGNPCVSLPGHTGPNGLPLGVQAVGASGDDDRLIGWSHWLSQRIL
jgi:amidase